MTDLDFDELDKAVNSLMDQKDQVAEPEESDTTSGAQSAQAQQSAVVDTPAASPEAMVSANAATSSVARRRGTFMDVVHPSSNMRTRVTQPVASVSREGVRLAPTPSHASENSMPEPTIMPRLEPRQSSDEELTSQLTQAKEAEHQVSSVTTYDPIAFAEQQETAVADEIQPVGGDENASEAQSSEPAVHDTPLESPFLPDAKVEKRPLGGTTESLQPISAEENAAAPSKLPDELSKQMMSIETEQSPALAVDEVQPVDEVVVAASIQTASPVEKAPQSIAKESSVHTAIPQQYTEKELDDSDDDHAAIYDPAYHQQNMKHQEKKHSGWWIVMLIILLIMLGGAGGVAYYYFTTGGF